MLSRKLHFFHGLTSSSRQHKNFFVFDSQRVDSSVNNRVLLYDVKAKCKHQWSFEFPDLTERYYPATALVRDHMYIFGGERYNTKTGKVANDVESISVKEMIGAKADDRLSWDSVRPMQVARGRFGAAVIQDIVYLVGGWGVDKKPLRDCESYDPSLGVGTDQTGMPDMNTARFGHAVIAQQDVLFAIGGTSKRGHPLRSCEMYDLRTSSWQQIAGMLNRRAYVSAVTLHGEIYAIGGEGQGHVAGSPAIPLSSVEKYDVRSNSWTEVANMSQTRNGCGACAVNNKIYVVGGHERESGEIEQTIEIYDPLAERWESKVQVELVHGPVAVRY